MYALCTHGLPPDSHEQTWTLRDGGLARGTLALSVGARGRSICRAGVFVALLVDVGGEGVGRDAAEPTDVDGLDLAVS